MKKIILKKLKFENGKLKKKDCNQKVFALVIYFLFFPCKDVADTNCPMDDKESLLIGQKCNYSSLKFCCNKGRSSTVV